MNPYDNWVPDLKTTDINALNALYLPKKIFNLPKIIEKELLGIMKAIEFKNGPKKFLFQGPPGIEKTHCVGVLTNTTKRQLYLLNWVQIISKSFEEYKKISWWNFWRN
ncbi:AAA family ATPase [Mycoplasmopsis citelli]|uniref:AAA family ATPase n=1 Tax=Mycoplasmopsis citelli TaxID=171281 RepID=A0A449B3C3_9BACT|nr:hypothetical protein [Mycoplasmopsis citelli]VEU75083.1 AAA family ATPase [Mycoplasmopsis citelli]